MGNDLICKTITIGCKTNFCDTEEIRRKLSHFNIKFIDENKCDSTDVDIYILNTCCVTQRAESKCYKTLRRLIRKNSTAKIIVVGCLATLKPESFSTYPQVISVIDNSKREEIQEIISNQLQLAVRKETNYQSDIQYTFSSHTRAFIKIQDGCDAFCSYCIVPYVRREVKSKPLDGVINETIKLVNNGYKEVVLTGTHLGFYGRDIGESNYLIRLVDKLEEINGLERFRLSSIEITDISESLINELRDSKKFCYHFHIPLQSGSNFILSKMKRLYTREYYLEKINYIRQCLPKATFSTDVIVGFPGETDDDFKDTLRVCVKANFFKIHIFPYSHRPIAKVEKLGKVLAQRVVTHRAKILERLNNILAKKNFRNRVGEWLDVLIEKKEKLGLYTGLSKEYFRVLVKGASEKDINQIRSVKITDYTDKHLIGELCRENKYYNNNA